MVTDVQPANESTASDGPDALSLARSLSDEEVIGHVQRLAGRERETTAVLIAHLAVFDERRLFLGQGCASMFAYCTDVLHLSEHGAYHRITAARAARKFPLILRMLVDGSANLATVGLIAPHLTPENHGDLLEAIRHKSKRQVEEIVVSVRPQVLVAPSVRKLPDPPLMPQELIQERPVEIQALTSRIMETPTENAPAPGLSPSATGMPRPLSPAPARGSSAILAPLAPARYRVQFTADADTYEQRLAQDMLRHQIPDGDIGQIISRALALLLRELARQKFAATERPRMSKQETGATRRARDVRNDTGPGAARTDAGSSAAGGRYIPAAVKRAVWLRDGGRCAFVAPDGRRCGRRAFIEFHHVVPHAMGGEPTARNIELRCRTHNLYEAELDFGPREIGHRGEQRARSRDPCGRSG